MHINIHFDTPSSKLVFHKVPQKLSEQIITNNNNKMTLL